MPGGRVRLQDWHSQVVVVSQQRQARPEQVIIIIPMRAMQLQSQECSRVTQTLRGQTHPTRLVQMRVVRLQDQVREIPATSPRLYTPGQEEVFLRAMSIC